MIWHCCLVSHCVIACSSIRQESQSCEPASTFSFRNLEAWCLYYHSTLNCNIDPHMQRRNAFIHHHKSTYSNNDKMENDSELSPFVVIKSLSVLQPIPPALDRRVTQTRRRSSGSPAARRGWWSASWRRQRCASSSCCTPCTNTGTETRARTTWMRAATTSATRRSPTAPSSKRNQWTLQKPQARTRRTRTRSTTCDCQSFGLCQTNLNIYRKDKSGHQHVYSIITKMNII